MDERVMQFRVGVMFLATLIITAILLMMFGKLPKLIGHYNLQVRFDYAAGVTKGTPVRKSGIHIGTVNDVKLTDRDSKVLVTLELQSDKIVYRNEDCYITRDLLGDTALSFIPNPERASLREPIAPGTILDGKFSEDPTGLKSALKGPIDTVESTGKALTVASVQLGEAAKRVEDILNPDAQQHVQEILRDSAKTLQTLQRVLGDAETERKLIEAVKRLPDTLESMNRTFEVTDDTLRKFSERSRIDGKTPVERMIGTIEMTEKTLRKFSEPSGPGRTAPAEQIAKAMDDVGEIARLIRSVVSRVEEGEGSLGALLQDRQLYDRLNRAARNLEEVSQRVKPVVEDARVFMDKVARHPGAPLRDAIKPGTGLK